MSSFRISLTPSQRAAARFVATVRRAIQKALAEEHEKRGLTQSDLARTIGVHRSVIHREIQGTQDMTLSRAAELASALGRKAVFDLVEPAAGLGTNVEGKIKTIITRSTTDKTARLRDLDNGKSQIRYDARAA